MNAEFKAVIWVGVFLLIQFLEYFHGLSPEVAHRDITFFYNVYFGVAAISVVYWLYNKAKNKEV